jgi:hypothetical protein
MKYAIAIFFPALAMLLCGEILQAVLCVVLHLTVIGWPLATIWAWLVIHDHEAQRRARQYSYGR